VDSANGREDGVDEQEQTKRAGSCSLGLVSFTNRTKQTPIMTNRRRNVLLNFLSDFIEEECKQQKVELLAFDREVLVNTTDSFVMQVVPKFVAGAKKHGNSLAERNCSFELQQELLDAFVYHIAATMRIKGCL
jgi:hypothetical protein